MNELTQNISHMRASNAAKRLSPVVALHCSGADGSQWSSLGSVFEGKATLIAPDFLGTRIRGHVDASKAFRLKHEAAQVIELIEEVAEPVHVVGHSYGGAVALHVASAVPQLVRSLCLPSKSLPRRAPMTGFPTAAQRHEPSRCSDFRAASARSENRRLPRWAQSRTQRQRSIL
ncbi:alpha/beta fold hydrolase [uncultured Roseobacter sp.]|uniref:alpha/beta fold hydrolase n=1 Tax=uncultured Roseobacter sp. TaxID=114847 RepID=UPI0026062073|nr:alpha/beta fold hydrolase [uncultured Roseobacter sp.]